MKDKPNPILEIVELCDIDGGEALTYFSKGVHDPIAFAAELLKEYDIVVRPENVKQCYMRWEWHTGPDGPVMCGEPHFKPGRGKFVVTYCEDWGRMGTTTAYPGCAGRGGKMKIEEILHPCSKCGRERRVMLQADFKPPKVYVICQDCYHRGPKIPYVNLPTTDDMITAIQAWNMENRSKRRYVLQGIGIRKLI